MGWGSDCACGRWDAGCGHGSGVEAATSRGALQGIGFCCQFPFCLCIHNIVSETDTEMIGNFVIIVDVVQIVL